MRRSILFGPFPAQNTDVRSLENVVQGGFSSEPFVVISTNQFHRCRLAEVTQSGFVVEFEAAPEPGDGSVIIWWLCVE